ncbi:MAG: DUF2007 domain-containing protein [Bacteroidota bacterium]|jgi:hypothetical protein
MKMVLVKNFPNRLLAEQARESLELEDIPSLVQASDTGIVGLGSISLPEGVDLYVPEEFAVRASEILQSIFNGI